MEKSTAGRNPVNVEADKNFSYENEKISSIDYRNLSDTALMVSETSEDDLIGDEQTKVCTTSSFEHTSLLENFFSELDNCAKDQGKKLLSIDAKQNKNDNNLLEEHCKKATVIDESHLLNLMNEMTPVERRILVCDSLISTELQSGIQADIPVHHLPISMRQASSSDISSSEGDESQSELESAVSLDSFWDSAKCRQRRKKFGVLVNNITIGRESRKLCIEDSNYGDKKRRECEFCAEESSESDIEDSDCDDAEDHLKCVFCEKLFGWKSITCLKLDAPLPSSFLDPVSLVQYFGIRFNFPFCGSDKTNVSFINVCPVCYDLMLEGDVLYHEFQLVIKQMRQLWANHMFDDDSSMISDVVSEDSFECPSAAGEKQRSEIISTDERHINIVNSKDEKHIRKETEGKKARKNLFGDEDQMNKVVSPAEKHSSNLTSYSKRKSTTVDKTLKIVLPNSELGVNLSESDEDLSDNEHNHSEICMNDEKGKPELDDKINTNAVLKESLTCGLCGKDFYVEDEWRYHLENYHKLLETWQHFSANDHKRLRSYMVDELFRYDICQYEHRFCKDRESVLDNITNDENSYVCHGCRKGFEDRNSLGEHFRNFHNITVDDSLLTGPECSYKDKLSQGVKQFPLIESELGESNLSSQSITSSDLLLDHNESYSLLNKSSRIKSNMSKTESENKISNYVETHNSKIYCSICLKDFQCKEDLINHAETIHLSYTIVEGGRDGISVCANDNVQSTDRIGIRQREESNQAIEKAVNISTELIDWQSDDDDEDDLEITFSFDDERRSCKTQVDKEASQQKEYACHLCGKRVKGKSYFLKHMKTMHFTYHLCNYCLFRCPKRHDLLSHYNRKHANLIKEQCEICGKYYSSAYLQEHKNSVHGSEKTHSCSGCGEKFFTKFRLGCHYYQAHGKKEWSQLNEFNCDECNSVFTNFSQLRVHIKKVHGTEKFKCDRCPKIFRLKTSLYMHTRKVHGKKVIMPKVTCEICGKIFAARYIKEHIQVIHGNERNHLCDLCGRKFFDRKGLRTHIYHEHEEREWKCDKCNIVFKKYFQLRLHITYVHSTKEFPCNMCSRIFRRKGDLTMHIKHVHENIKQACQYCSKQYKEYRKLSDHLVNVHGLSKEETYKEGYARHKRANNDPVKNRENIEKGNNKITWTRECTDEYEEKLEISDIEV